MKKGIVFPVLVLILCAYFSYAEENDYADDEKSSSPPGMSIEKVGDLNILVPKGSQVTRSGKGGLIVVEKTDEYVSRQLLEIENRFERLEKGLEALKEETKQLKEAVNQLQNRGLISR